MASSHYLSSRGISPACISSLLVRMPVLLDMGLTPLLYDLILHLQRPSFPTRPHPDHCRLRLQHIFLGNTVQPMTGAKQWVCFCPVLQMGRQRPGGLGDWPRPQYWGRAWPCAQHASHAAHRPTYTTPSYHDPRVGGAFPISQVKKLRRREGAQSA